MMEDADMINGSANEEETLGTTSVLSLSDKNSLEENNCNTVTSEGSEGSSLAQEGNTKIQAADFVEVKDIIAYDRDADNQPQLQDDVIDSDITKELSSVVVREVNITPGETFTGEGVTKENEIRQGNNFNLDSTTATRFGDADERLMNYDRQQIKETDVTRITESNLDSTRNREETEPFSNRDEKLINDNKQQIQGAEKSMPFYINESLIDNERITEQDQDRDSKYSTTNLDSTINEILCSNSKDITDVQGGEFSCQSEATRAELLVGNDVVGKTEGKLSSKATEEYDGFICGEAISSWDNSMPQSKHLVYECEENPKEKAFRYLEESGVLRMFQNLAASIVQERPEEPLLYMIDVLEGGNEVD